MKRFDVIVIGTGGMGASAAMHLASRGVRVCGLDRFPPGHDRGSSHRQTRLIRMAYYEHPDYVPLLRRSYELWHDLETIVGRTLLVESGLLLAGPPDGAVVAGTLRSAAIHSLPVEPMTGRDASDRWPSLRIPEEWTAVYEARGGYLLVEDCVAAHAAAAVRLGAHLDHGCTVRGWRTVGHGDHDRHVIVETDIGSYAADRLVVTAGAWAGDLLQLPSLPMKVLRKSLFWYQPEATRAAAYAAGRLPCFAFDGPTGFFYGFPAIDERGVKIAEHTGGTPVADPLSLDRGIDAREQERVEAVLADHLPKLRERPSLRERPTAHSACLYTMSPDGHFVVGLHPRHPNVTIAAGFSGHGFKFASVIGEILADLALQGKTGHPIGFLSPQRFASA